MYNIAQISLSKKAENWTNWITYECLRIFMWQVTYKESRHSLKSLKETDLITKSIVLKVLLFILFDVFSILSATDYAWKNLSVCGEKIWNSTLRESPFNMTRMGGGGGGWRYWNSKLEILAAPLASGSVFWEPPLLLVLKYRNFRSPS